MSRLALLRSDLASDLGEKDYGKSGGQHVDSDEVEPYGIETEAPQRAQNDNGEDKRC